MFSLYFRLCHWVCLRFFRYPWCNNFPFAIAAWVPTPFYLLNSLHWDDFLLEQRSLKTMELRWGFFVVLTRILYDMVTQPRKLLGVHDWACRGSPCNLTSLSWSKPMMDYFNLSSMSMIPPSSLLRPSAPHPIWPSFAASLRSCRTHFNCRVPGTSNSIARRPLP